MLLCRPRLPYGGPLMAGTNCVALLIFTLLFFCIGILAQSDSAPDNLDDDWTKFTLLNPQLPDSSSDENDVPPQNTRTFESSSEDSDNPTEEEYISYLSNSTNNLPLTARSRRSVEYSEFVLSPPRIVKDLQPILRLKYQTARDVICLSTGRPVPNIRWYTMLNNSYRLAGGEDNIYTVDGGRLQFFVNTDKLPQRTFFCEVENSVGVMRSRKMVVHQVPLYDGIKKIVYNTFAVPKGDKAVVNCCPDQELFSRFFRVKYWNIRFNSSYTKTISVSEGRYSLINVTKRPELHIRNITDADFKAQVSCVMQSIVDENTLLQFHDTQALQKQDMIFTYYLLKTENNEVTVRKGTTVELPLAIEGDRVPMSWYWLPQGSDPGQQPKRISPNQQPGSKYVAVPGDYGNIRIVNMTVGDSGVYTCRNEQGNKQVSFTIRVTDPLNVTLTPQYQAVVWGERAEINCSVTGHPKERIYWLHNGKHITSTSNRSLSKDQISLVIPHMRLDDVGVYQCVVETGSTLEEPADNAQADSGLMLQSMKPTLIRQIPSVERGSNSAQVLVSRSVGAMLECHFAGHPSINITWFRDDHKIPLTDALDPQIYSGPHMGYVTNATLKIDLDRVGDPLNVWKYGGEYKAVAYNRHGQAECRTLVLISNTKPRMRHVEPVQTAIAGRSYTLKCFFIGPDNPKLTWIKIKDGVQQKLPVDHRQRLSNNNRELVIADVDKKEDEATYKCTAFLGGQEVANSSVTLKVALAPVLQNINPPEELQEKNTKQLSFSCLATTGDPPWYAWWEFLPINGDPKRDVKILISDRDDSIDVQYSRPRDDIRWSLPESLRGQVPEFVVDKANRMAQLMLKPKKDIHTGNFTCMIQNAVGAVHKTFPVTFVPELKFEHAPPNQQQVTVGQDLSINCTAVKKDIQPLIVWKFSLDGGATYQEVNKLAKVTNGRIKQLENGTLQILDVHETDPHKFLCFLIPNTPDTETQSSRKSRAVNIDIHIPARIDPISKEEVVMGTAFNLTCSVRGDIKEIDATWYKWDEGINGNIAWQKLRTPCSFNMVPQVTARGQRLEGGFQRDKFSCHTGAGIDEEIQLKQIILFKKDGRGLDNHLHFTSVSESDQAKYECRASNSYNPMVNKVRQQDKKEGSIYVISAPGKVQIKKDSYVSTSYSIYVKWSPPSKDGNKPILRYLLKYAQVIEGEDFVKQTARNLSSTTLSYTLTQLRPYTRYNIRMSAVNKVGRGIEDTITVSTQEAKPEGPVQSLKANGTSSNTIVVKWEDPKPELRNGFIDKYLVCYKKIDDTKNNTDLASLGWPEDPIVPFDHRKFNVHCDTVRNQQHCEVIQLPKFTAYAFLVLAVNTKGSSPPAYITARTLEDLPMEPPRDVNCTVYERAIKLTWNPPAKHTINGILTEYQVRYFESNSQGDESGMDTRSVRDRNTVTLSKLRPYTNYTVEVSTCNRKGSGPPSPRLVCRTKESRPDAPRKAKARPVNSTCIVASWLHPARPNGRIRQYCVQALYIFYDDLSPKQERCHAADLSRPYNFAYICDLSQDFAYNISIRAVNTYRGVCAYTNDVRPIENPLSGIISIGYPIDRLIGSDVVMDCLGTVPTNHQFSWLPSVELPPLPNGTITITNLQEYHAGLYTCSSGLDSIEYDLKVQEVLDVAPVVPILGKLLPNSNGIQIHWRSGGVVYKASPILNFYVHWTNSYTGQSKTERVPASNRSFYLDPLTCGTEVVFAVRAQNKIGNSSFSDPKSVRTLGSAPAPANVADLIPDKYRYTGAAYFNLSSFEPRSDCRPMKFSLEIWPSAIGPNTLDERGLLLNRTFAKYELSGPDKCCFNVTNLNANSNFRFRATAFNPAGSTAISGHFYTLTLKGKAPAVNRNHREGSPPILQRPSILIPVISGFVILFFIIVGVFLYYRRRNFEEKHPPMQDEYRPEVQHPPLRHRNQRLLPDTPNREAEARRIYARGGIDPNMGMSAPDHIPEDRLSSRSSLDSEGNINPYATYEAGAIRQLSEVAPREVVPVERERAVLQAQRRRNPGGPMIAQQFSQPAPSRAEPYENDESTLGGHGRSGRRSNSMDQLHRILAAERGGNTTYSSGYATGDPGTRTGNTQASYYDSKPTESVCRGSMLSSTTVSSNHDELDQAYEFGKGRAYSTLPRHLPAHHGPLRLGQHLIGEGRSRGMVPPTDEDAEPHSGESGSSETTDPGIRQFTQQPPRPDEARHATCEVPMMYGGKFGPGGTPIAVATGSAAGKAPPPSFMRGRSVPERRVPMQRGISECSDTYEPMDYTSGEYPPPPGPSGGMRFVSRMDQPLPSVPPSRKTRFTRPGRTESESTYGSHLYDTTTGPESVYYGPPASDRRKGSIGAAPAGKIHPRDLQANRGNPRYFTPAGGGALMTTSYSGPSERGQLAGRMLPGATGEASANQMPHAAALYGPPQYPDEAVPLMNRQSSARGPRERGVRREGEEEDTYNMDDVLEV